jgi:nucleoid DNA-binding protein
MKGGKIMTKAELIDKIAAGAGLSKADASRALDSTLDAISITEEKPEGYACGFGRIR